MQYILVWCAAWFSLGIWAASLVKLYFIPWLLLALAPVIVCSIFFKKKLLFTTSAWCAFFLLGAALLSSRQVIPENHISNFLWQPKDSLCTVKGLVDTQPDFKFPDTVFELEAEELQGSNFKVNCCGRVLVHVKGSKNLLFGQKVMLKGRLSSVGKAYGTQGARYREYLVRRGIYAKMHVPFVALATIEAQPRRTVKAVALRLKDMISAQVACYLDPVPASVVNAMILGEKKGIPPLVYQAMMKTGTVHILVVSGFNTNLVIGIIMLLLRAMRFPRKARFLIALPFLFGYCLATGASPPVMRATVMTLVFMAVYYFKREADIFNACAFALLVILFFDPWQLLGISLQLSFACVLAIAFLYPKFKALFRVDAIKNQVFLFIADAFLVSLSAWIGTMGILAWYFRSFSLVTVLANIIIVPLATLITLSGVSLVCVALFCPALAVFIGHACQLFVALLLTINYLLLKIPFANISW